MHTYKLKRSLYGLAAVVMTAASAAPALMQTAKASAYTLPTSRSIELSSSLASATNTIYTLGFTTNQNGANVAVAGMVVDFCSNSPIIGDSCTAPAGFDLVKATLALANQVGIGANPWSVDTTNSTANKLVLSRTSGTINTATALALDIGTAANGVTNPSATNSTFYARVLTYDTAANAAAYTSTAAGGGTGTIDAGGVALSTANSITVTSKVQERLTFCVYTGANCAAGGNAINLGDTNGVLDPNGPYVDKNTKYDVASNASSGVAIRVKGDTLKTGGFSISAIGATAAASSAGSEQFGFCTEQTAGATITPAAPYNDANCSTTTQSAGTATPGGIGTAQFAFDTANTNTTYGQVFANAVAGASSTGSISFLGNISNTTEAGIYTTTLTFIATGTY